MKKLSFSPLHCSDVSGVYLQVSKLFHDVTRDPLIWKTIYASARVPRPPGPFPYQSTRFLAQTLTRSERLAERWTTQPLQAVPSTQIRFQASTLGQPRIISGRWLMTFESYGQIVLHDIETIWEDAGLLASWDACSVISADRLSVYVVFRKAAAPMWRVRWYA